MELQRTIEIARPPADVYAFVATDHEKNHPRWDPAISDMRQQTPGPVAVTMYAPAGGAGVRVYRPNGLEMTV